VTLARGVPPGLCCMLPRGLSIVMDDLRRNFAWSVAEARALAVTTCWRYRFASTCAVTSIAFCSKAMSTSSAPGPRTFSDMKPAEPPIDRALGLRERALGLRERALGLRDGGDDGDCGCCFATIGIPAGGNSLPAAGAVFAAVGIPVGGDNLPAAGAVFAAIGIPVGGGNLPAAGAVFAAIGILVGGDVWLVLERGVSGLPGMSNTDTGRLVGFVGRRQPLGFASACCHLTRGVPGWLQATGPRRRTNASWRST